MEMYNEAIQLLKQQEFIKAEQLLLQLSKENQETDEVKWALGLIQIYLGKPYQAIAYWQTVKDINRYEIDKNIAKLESILPSYDQLYEKYNQALALIKEKQFDNALANFNECLMFKDAIPLEIYEGYVNLAYYLEKDDLVEEMLKHAPKYVLTTNKIHRTLLLKKNTKQILQENKQLQDNEKSYQQKVISTRKQRNVFIAGALAIAMALVATIVNENKENIGTDLVPIVAESEVKTETETVSEKAQDNNQKFVRELEQKIASLEEQLTESSVNIKELQEKESMLLQKNISLDSILADAQEKQYQTGYYYYQKRQYEISKDFLQKSMELEQDVYYADDAHYYLIQSKVKTGDNNLREDFDRFINNEFVNYQQSPYYDDILLQYAQYEMAQGNSELTKQLLSRITTDYSQEWTAERATILLDELAEQ